MAYLRKRRIINETISVALATLSVAAVCAAGADDGVHELLAGQRDFDGLSDRAEQAFPDSVRRYTQETVVGWVYPRVPAGALRNRHIVSQPYRLELGMTSNAEDAGVFDTTGPLAGSVYTRNADGSWSRKQVVSGKALEADRWSHVAMTYDGKTLRLFVDGEDVAMLEETGTLSDDARTTKAAVGCSAGGWEKSQFWAGLLRDLRMHGRALSAPEIVKLASKRPPLPPKDRKFRCDGPPIWVFNPGLEGDYRAHPVYSYPQRWYGSIWGKAKGRWRQDTAYPHSGQASLMMEVEEMPSGGMSFYQPRARIALVPGRTYVLSAWMRSDFDVDVSMGFHTGSTGFTQRFSTVRRWQKYTFRETYTGVTTSGCIIFYYNSKRAGNLVIDAVELTVADETRNPRAP